MKKILTHLTGIVFLTTILIAGGCAQEPDPPTNEIRGKVKIFCKATEENGVMRFEMYDPNSDTRVEAEPSDDNPTKLSASLVTFVEAGTKVIWKWENGSVAKKFIKIGPETPGQIITGNAEKVFLSGNFQLKVPNDATTGQESYFIEFEDSEGNPYKVDPYLKIR